MCITWLLLLSLITYTHWWQLTTVDSVTPLAVLTGHEQSVVCVAVSFNLGIVVSGAKCEMCTLDGRKHVNLPCLLAYHYNDLSWLFSFRWVLPCPHYIRGVASQAHSVCRACTSSHDKHSNKRSLCCPLCWPQWTPSSVLLWREAAVWMSTRRSSSCKHVTTHLRMPTPTG